MQNQVSISIYHDTRRKKANNKFPIKLRVFTKHPRKQMFYPTKFEFDKEEFKKIWLNIKPRKDHKDIKLELQAIEHKAVQIAESLKSFNFTAFEDKLFGTAEPLRELKDVLTVFKENAEDKLISGAVSTAEKYERTLINIRKFLRYKGKKDTALEFQAITKNFLEKYERYFISNVGLSIPTVSIDLRNIRAIYRIGIKRGYVTAELYPFGTDEDKYTIKRGGKVNKALTKDQIELLKKGVPQDEAQALAKDFWFFSYYSFGMNIRDILELKHTSVNGKAFSYIRTKTKTTKKQVSIKEVPLTQNHLEIIGRRKIETSTYLFGVLNDDLTPVERHNKVKNFNKYINKHFRRFAIAAGLEKEIASQLGTYHSRHTFTTLALKAGNSLALISEILHDGNIQTTQAYINSFSKDTYVDLANSL